MDTNNTFKQKVANFLSFFMSDKRRILICIGCFILILGFLFTAVFYYSKPNSSDVTSSLPPDVGISDKRSQSNMKKTTPASLSLVIRESKKTYRIDDTITFIIVGDTGRQALRGYDAVFKYDKELVRYERSKNLDNNFDYQQRIRGDWVMISGVQKLDSSDLLGLKNKDLIEIQFKARKSGIAYFPMSFVDGRLSDSNIINDHSQDILTAVNGISVEITE